jgi:S-DNA-T family DNA segregation ATPase FtsK/SpoIIIE
MWLDPIPGIININELVNKYTEPANTEFLLNPAIGEYDDPAHQSQGILRIPITSEGNTIVYS